MEHLRLQTITEAHYTVRINHTMRCAGLLCEGQHVMDYRQRTGGRSIPAEACFDVLIGYAWAMELKAEPG